MKKTMVILPVCISLLFGCDKTTEQVEKVESKQETNVQEQSYVDRIEDVVIEGDFKDGEIESHYEYHIPKILDDSNDAEWINSYVIDLVSGYEDPELFNYASMTYNTYFNDEVVSICIELEYAFVPMMEYVVVNYDFKEGEELFGDSLVDHFGVDYDVMLTSYEVGIVDCFDQSAKGYVDAYPTWQIGYRDLRSQSIGMDNLMYYSEHLYMNEQLELEAIANIGTPAGAGIIQQQLDLNSYMDQLGVTYYEDDLVQVEYNCVEPCITFLDEVMQNDALFTEFEENVPYIIGGANKHFVDCVRKDACLYFLDEEGYVSVVDLGGCLYYGNYFVMYEPCLENGTYQTLDDVNFHEINETILSMKQTQSTYMNDIELNGVSDGYSLYIDEEGWCQYIKNGDIVLGEIEQLEYLGMSYDGQLYGFLMETNGNQVVGTLCVFNELAQNSYFVGVSMQQTGGNRIEGFEEYSEALFYLDY